MTARALLPAFLSGLVTLPSMCNVYKTDVGKVCDAQQLSQASLRSGKSQLFTWLERNVASSQGVILVKDIEGKDSHDIGVLVRDEARKVGLSACALADQADLLARDEAYRTDITNLCAGNALRTDGSIARLDIVAADDAERMRDIVAWTTTNAHSPDTAAFVSRLAGTPVPQRGALLRAEATRVEVPSCLMAATLDSRPPPPPVPIAARAAFPNFAVQKVDAPAKNTSVIASRLTSPDVAGPINDCYGGALLASPTVSGRMSVELTIDGGTRVTKVHADDISGIKAPTAACVVTILQAVSFDKPLPEPGKKGQKASVTLSFSPSPAPGYAALVDLSSPGKSSGKHGR
jgi:hypothetical protein